MIHPVKVYDKHGQLVRTISTAELLEMRERDYARPKKTLYRKRAHHLARAKNQATTPVASRQGDAAPQAERPSDPVRSAENRGVDAGKCQEIDKDKTFVSNYMAQTRQIFKFIFAK